MFAFEKVAIYQRGTHPSLLPLTSLCSSNTLPASPKIRPPSDQKNFRRCPWNCPWNLVAMASQGSNPKQGMLNPLTFLSSISSQFHHSCEILSFPSQKWGENMKFSNSYLQNSCLESSRRDSRLLPLLIASMVSWVSQNGGTLLRIFLWFLGFLCERWAFWFFTYEVKNFSELRIAFLCEISSSFLIGIW